MYLLDMAAGVSQGKPVSKAGATGARVPLVPQPQRLHTCLSLCSLPHSSVQEGTNLRMHGCLGTVGHWPLVWQRNERIGWGKKIYRPEIRESNSARSRGSPRRHCIADIEGNQVRPCEVGGGWRSPGKSENNKKIGHLIR